MIRCQILSEYTCAILDKDLNIISEEPIVVDKETKRLIVYYNGKVYKINRWGITYDGELEELSDFS